MLVPSEGVYSLLIEISKENCTSIVRRLVLVSTVNISLRVGTTLMFSIPPVLLLGLAVGVRRIYVRRRKERSVQLLAMKKRFDDVKNIIGFLVIYKTRGLPIYSRIMKGGFEEGMLSGFITAITHFASELREDAKLWTAFPISEVVTAVSTEHLICALMTVDSPSDSLIARLEEIGLALGNQFDTEERVLSEISQNVEKSKEYGSIIDTLFFNQFDGILTSRYLPCGSEVVPRRMMSIEDVFATADDEGITPAEIINRLLLAGIDDWTAHSLVLESIESGFILCVDK
jgi:hypothetical protein